MSHAFKYGSSPKLGTQYIDNSTGQSYVYTARGWQALESWEASMRVPLPIDTPSYANQMRFIRRDQLEDWITNQSQERGEMPMPSSIGQYETSKIVCKGFFEAYKSCTSSATLHN